MKVTISAPFGRVQVELSAGETAQLMLDAVGMAEHRQRILEATEEKTGDESEDIATPVCALARNDADILKVSNAGVEDENGGGDGGDGERRCGFGRDGRAMLAPAGGHGRG